MKTPPDSKTRTTRGRRLAGSSFPEQYGGMGMPYSFSCFRRIFLPPRTDTDHVSRDSVRERSTRCSLHASEPLKDKFLNSFPVSGQARCVSRNLRVDLTWVRCPQRLCPSMGRPRNVECRSTRSPVPRSLSVVVIMTTTTFSIASWQDFRRTGNERNQSLCCSEKNRRC